MKSVLRFLHKTLLWALSCAAAAGLGLAATVWYLNLDKTGVFLDVAGELGRVDTVSTRETDTSTVRELKLHNTRGEYLVDCLYRRPRKLSEPYKVLVLYAGVKTKAVILDLIPDRPDLVICAIQYPYRRPRTFLDYVRFPWTVRSDAYTVVGGGILATSFLIDREKLNASQVIAVGASLGSFFGTIHTALDPRISTMLVVHGGGNFPVLVKGYRRFREKGHPVAVYAVLSDWLFGTFDPLRYVDRIAPRELVILATTNDKYFPPESAQSLYDRANEPKQLIWMNTTHVRSQKSEILDMILKSLLAYLFPEPAS